MNADIQKQKVFQQKKVIFSVWEQDVGVLNPSTPTIKWDFCDLQNPIFLLNFLKRKRNDIVCFRSLF